MSNPESVRRRASLICTIPLLAMFLCAPTLNGDPATPTSQTAAEAAQQQKREQTRRFQDQELITARPFTFIFNPNDPPRIVWRDAQEVKRLGGDERLRVRWFNADLNETDKPARPGRWGAIVEGTAPNGTPVRRGMTFFCRPPGFLLYFPQTAPASLPHMGGPIEADVWREHQDEIKHLTGDILFRGLNDTESGTILIAGLSEMKPAARPALTIESAAVRNDDYHLALKLKVCGLEGKTNPLDPPRRRAIPAPALHEGSMERAGMRPDAQEKLDAVCQAWVKDSGEPFVTLVARYGVIVLHRAYGSDKDNKPIDLDYRADVFSITKTVTAILFSQFLDQQRVKLDDSIAKVFPDYPDDLAHVPTFRQCLTHMSGLSGHGDWNGVRNPYLDNIVLNGIDVNEPGSKYVYTGMGFDLTAEAMELMTGKSALHLYRDHLFAPLGMGDVPMGNASAGAQLTARELAILAQWLVNQGSYGSLEFISKETFSQMLPEDLGRRYPGVTDIEGIGMHWMHDRKPGAPAQSTKPADLLLSPRTLGHGSLSSCILRADLDQGIVVAQIRKQAGPRCGEWGSKLFQAIAASALPDIKTSENP